jgi:hypothetical protein
VAKSIAGAGVVLVLATSAAAGAFSLGALVFAGWALVPYALLLLLARRIADRWSLAFAAVALLLAELYVRAEVFLFPKSSTAALVLIFSPLYLTGVVLPAGLGVGWLSGWAWRRAGVAGRAALVAAGAVCLLAGGLAYVRPGLLPGGAGRLVSAKERIGPPRVAAGEGFFTKTRWSRVTAWHQVGEFDGAPGTEVARIEASAVALLDPSTGTEKARIALGDQARRKWNWFSRLVRDGSELLIVQTGGGYQGVEVIDLEGRTRWAFRPHPSLPPIALLPRDLDRDGRPDFYAASKGSVYRVDSSGRIVWERTMSGLVTALDVAEAGGGQPGLVMAGDGRSLRLWTATGELVKTLELPDQDYRYKIIDWPDTRSVIGGSDSVKALDLESRSLFRHALGDFRHQDSFAVRLGGDDTAFLAVVATAPREVGYGRLLLFSKSGQVVYDEILARSVTALTAPDGGAGRQMLLLSGDGLWAYRK